MGENLSKHQSQVQNHKKFESPEKRTIKTTAYLKNVKETNLEHLKLILYYIELFCTTEESS